MIRLVLVNGYIKKWHLGEQMPFDDLKIAKELAYIEVEGDELETIKTVFGRWPHPDIPRGNSIVVHGDTAKTIASNIARTATSKRYVEFDA